MSDRTQQLAALNGPLSSKAQSLVARQASYLVVSGPSCAAQERAGGVWGFQLSRCAGKSSHAAAVTLQLAAMTGH